MKIEETAIILHNRIYENSPEDVLDIIRQAKWLEKILKDCGYKVLLMPFSPESISALSILKEATPIRVINLVDSAPGEESLSYLATGILEYLKIKYTGCSMKSLFITTDKILTKVMLKAAGILTPEWVYENETNGFYSGVKYIIKALSEDASIGLTDKSVMLVNSLKELQDAMNEKEIEIGKKVFAERYIEGREFNVCMYGKLNEVKILPPYEWVFEGFDEHKKIKIFTYDAKWTENTYEYDHVKADYHLSKKDNDLLLQLEAISKQCWEKFELKGYARLDFRIDAEGRPWVLEINCNPSLYGYRNIAREKNMEFTDIFKDIIDAE